MTAILSDGAQVRVYWNGRQQAVRRIPRGRELILGSGPKADLRLPDPAVSRLHCVIAGDDRGRWTVRDLNSANGTYVNGEPIRAQTTLDVGDLVQLGYVTVVFLGENNQSGEEEQWTA